LKVISRSSVMQYREERPPAPQIADDLGVDFILEGSARIAGDQVRLTAQLIDARRDEHLWSDDYDRELSVENIFAVQSDIAQRVASETRAVLTPEEQTRVEARPTESLEAYNAYLLGRLLWDQWTPESFQRQIEYYEEAIRRDSTFALAYAALGEVLAATPWSGRPPLLPLSEAHSRAVAAVNRALEIDDGLAEAHNTLGYIKSTFDWDLKGAEEEYRRAIELNPNLAASHNYLGCELLPYTRRFDEAIAEMRIAIALSPFDFMIRGCFNTTLMSAGRFDEYHQQRRLVREMFPDHDWSNVNVQFCALIAEERWEEAIELDPQNPGATMAYMVLGRRDEALAVAKSWEDGHAFDRFSALSGIGDLDGAFAILEQLVEERDPIVLALPNVWPCFKSLHTDPRWADYLRRIGVEE
ncbi:MAG: hypothetical protein KAJ42_04685, partial [Gemmatimonadetes bacterium]|nr:hypothetical protein [Gemmatimonadota bacterium]